MRLVHAAAARNISAVVALVDKKYQVYISAYCVIQNQVFAVYIVTSVKESYYI